MDPVREGSTAQFLILAFALPCCDANDDIHRPAIGAITPDRGTPGLAVNITGRFFCAQPDPEAGEEVDALICENIGAVAFGATPASFTQYTDTSILVEVPDGMRGATTVRVSVAGRSSNGVRFVIE
jgi:hypothetical protein